MRERIALLLTGLCLIIIIGIFVHVDEVSFMDRMMEDCSKEVKAVTVDYTVEKKHAIKYGVHTIYYAIYTGNIDGKQIQFESIISSKSKPVIGENVVLMVNPDNYKLFYCKDKDKLKSNMWILSICFGVILITFAIKPIKRKIAL